MTTINFKFQIGDIVNMENSAKPCRVLGLYVGESGKPEVAIEYFDSNFVQQRVYVREEFVELASAAGPFTQPKPPLSFASATVMNDLTALLFSKPAPLPDCVRRVDHGLELPKPQAPVTSNTDGQYRCASCGNWKPASEMHHRRDGRCGTVCIACTERNIALREKREELSDPAKVARRIAKSVNCIITELRGDYLVYRKTSPPAYVGKAKTAASLLKLMRRVARNV